MNDPSKVEQDNNNLSERLLDDVEQLPPSQDDDFAMHHNGEIIVVDPLQAGMGLRGETQSSEYRDLPFAIGFVAHLLVVTMLAFSWGIGSLTPETSTDDDDGDNSVVRLHGLLWLCLLTSLVSVGISAGSLELMTRYADQLIQISLMASCVLLTVMTVGSFAMGAAGVGFLFLFFLVLAGLYAYSVWNRIPFAAANLRTGLAAIKTNYGVCMLAYGISFCANLWVFLWVLAFIGISYKESTCQNSDTGVCQSHVDPISTVLLLVSYHWTSQVLKNVLHVTIAGVVGTWWFAPQEANSVFSPAIQDSFRRATTYSFGSICMGSLLVAIIQTLEQMARNARRSNRGGILLCILECLLYYIQQIAQYFNKWAFVYVGLYGYDYVTAGKKVISLFQERGWTTIISDNLVQRTLVLVCLVIAGLTGLVGCGLAKVSGWVTPIFGDEDANTFVFFIGFIIGLSMAVIMMDVVLSAVDTIIVSFAEAPAEFETNHPALCQQMKDAWRQVYPEECGFEQQQQQKESIPLM